MGKGKGENSLFEWGREKCTGAWKGKKDTPIHFSAKIKETNRGRSGREGQRGGEKTLGRKYFLVLPEDEESNTSAIRGPREGKKEEATVRLEKKGREKRRISEEGVSLLEGKEKVLFPSAK